MKQTIYLDNAATTPMFPEVIKVMTDALEKNYGNASSIYQLGKKNRVLIEQARTKMADSIGAKDNEIVITSGGTESDNMAIIKSAEKYAHRGKHIITTAIEHPAVLEPLQYLESLGFEVTYLPVNQDGKVTLKQVKNSIRPDTILISMMYGNNEMGALLPVSEVGAYLKTLKQEIIFHTDAVQAYGVLPLDVQELNVDLLSVSGHKVNGPKGIGFLYVNENLKLPSLILGGSQENNQRAGTENVPAILGFEKAIELTQDNLNQNYKHLVSLKETFIKLLEDEQVDYSVNGEVKNNLPQIINICFPKVRSDMLLIQMDLQGIALSAGSACSAGALEPSHVLKAMYGSEALELSHSVRISFGYNNTIEELKKLVQILKKYTS